MDATRSSVDTLLIEMGELKQLAQTNRETLLEVDKKLTIQNGRVGKLEIWQGWTKGIAAIVVLILIPVAIKIMTSAYVIVPVVPKVGG